MKKLLFCFSFFIFSFSFSYGQTWDWGREGYGSLKANDYGVSVATDGSGNAYITGQFESFVTFGKFSLTGAGDNVYLAKYDPSGNVIWAVQPNDTSFYGFGYGTSVALDYIGNIYVTGLFFGTLILGNDTLRSSLSPTSSVFLIKYNSSGKALWAKQSITPNNNSHLTDKSFAVTSDQSNNMLITGTFADSITFGAYTLITPLHTSSVFLVKYDPSGNVIWARCSTAKGDTNKGASVITDNQNNIYITGYFQDSISFASYSLRNYGHNSAFLAKYSSTGNVLWARQSYENAGKSFATSVIHDVKPNLYIAGYFTDSVHFGSHALYSPSDSSAFLVKYDTAGNVIWAKQSSQGMQATSLSEDGEGYLYMGGITCTARNSYNFGKFKFNPVPKRDTGNAFLLKFDTAGIAICGNMLANMWYKDQAVCVAADSISSTQIIVYLTGTFGNNYPVMYDTVVCAHDTLLSYTTEASVFLGRWFDCSQQVTGISEMQDKSAMVKVYPNPSSGNFIFIIASEAKQSLNTVKIYNALGQQVYESNINSDNTEVNLSNQPNGVYLYRVISATNDLVGEGKIVVQR